MWGGVPDPDREVAHLLARGATPRPTPFPTVWLALCMARQACSADPPSAWLPRNLPRQNQGQAQTLPEPLLPTCDLAAWIPNCRILIPSGASIVGQLIPHN